MLRIESMDLQRNASDLIYTPLPWNFPWHRLTNSVRETPFLNLERTWLLRVAPLGVLLFCLASLP